MVFGVVVAFVVASIAFFQGPPDWIPLARGLLPQGVALPVPNRPAQLYVLTEVPRPDGTMGAGRITVLDLKTQHEVYSINTGVDVDAALAPGGSRLFFAAVDVPPNNGTGVDHLSAIDTKTRATIWRTAIQNRVKYITGGPPTLALSPDGRWIFVFSFPTNNQEQYPKDAQLPYWIQVVDAHTGRLLPATIPLVGCGAAGMAPSPDGRLLYVTCYVTNDLRVIDAQTFHPLTTIQIPETASMLGKPGAIVGSALSPDGRWLYVVQDTFQVAVVDTRSLTLAKHVILGPPPAGRKVDDGLVALSSNGDGLVLGENVEGIPGTATASEFHLYDTRSWREEQHVELPHPVGRRMLSVGPSGRAIYVIGSRIPPAGHQDTIFSISLEEQHPGQTGALTVHAGEDIFHLFLGSAR